MSPYLYRRLMRDKLAALRRRAGAAPESGSATTASRTTYRQLDQRSADGLAVTLEWNPTTDALRVMVVDRESEAVTFPVSAADASDAFVHPFIYAGRAACETAPTEVLG